MPVYDRVFKAKYGTDTTVDSPAASAIWVRVVDWSKDAPINITQQGNIYLDAKTAREFAAYLMELADKIEGINATD